MESILIYIHIVFNVMYVMRTVDMFRQSWVADVGYARAYLFENSTDLLRWRCHIVIRHELRAISVRVVAVVWSAEQVG